jgi:hypothetical protein
MRKVLLMAGALGASALLIPGESAAQPYGFRGGAPGFRAGGLGGPALARPGLGYGVRSPGYYRGAYGWGGGYRGYRGWGYGGAVAAGLIGGLALGALTAPAYSYPAYGYPAYGYPAYGYPYDYGGYAEPIYAAPVAGLNCWQGPPLCTAAGYPNMGYVRRQYGAPF